MVITQDADGRSTEVETASLSGTQSEPTGGEDAQYVTVSEDKGVTLHNSYPVKHVLRT